MVFCKILYFHQKSIYTHSEVSFKLVIDILLHFQLKSQHIDCVRYHFNITCVVLHGAT